MHRYKVRLTTLTKEGFVNTQIIDITATSDFEAERKARLRVDGINVKAINTQSLGEYKPDTNLSNLRRW